MSNYVVAPSILLRLLIVTLLLKQVGADKQASKDTQATEEGTRCLVIGDTSKVKGREVYRIQTKDVPKLFAGVFKSKRKLLRDRLKSGGSSGIKPLDGKRLATAYTDLRVLKRNATRTYDGGSARATLQRRILSAPSPCPHFYCQSDNSMCCLTCRHWERYDVVLDGGTVWHVLQFPDEGRYQWVQLGLCGISNGCNGNCVQDYNSHTVLVSSEDPRTTTIISITFLDMLYPSNCKCIP